MFTATVWKNFACIQITSLPVIHEMPSAHLLYKNGIAVEKGLNGNGWSGSPVYIFKFLKHIIKPAKCQSSNKQTNLQVILETK